MKHIHGKFAYECIVRDLADEFAVEIDNGAARSVANAVIAAFEVRDHQPIVLDTVEYEGGTVESLDSCLAPYDVLQYSDADNLPDDGIGEYRDQVAGRAAEALTLDLLDERGLESQ